MRAKGNGISFGDASVLVKRYLDENAAAVELYDRTNNGPHDAVLPIDLLSLSALNAYTGGASMTVMAEIWPFRAEIASRVKGITTKSFALIPVDQLESEQQRISDLLDWFWKKPIPQWSGHGTRPAKLMHRLRPNIIPIWDERIGTWYEGPKESWASFIKAIHSHVADADTRDCLDRINVELGANLPLLRLWDILLWKSDLPKDRSA
jgi:hypothetical protein